MQNFRFCASCAQLYQTQMGNITKRHTIAYNWHKNGNHYTSLAANVADCTFYSNHVLSVCFLFDGLNSKQSCIWHVEFLWITRICSIAVNLVWYCSCPSKYSLACCWHILSFWYHGAVCLVGCTSNTIFVCLNCAASQVVELSLSTLWTVYGVSLLSNTEQFGCLTICEELARSGSIYLCIRIFWSHWGRSKNDFLFTYKRWGTVLSVSL